MRLGRGPLHPRCQAPAPSEPGPRSSREVCSNGGVHGWAELVHASIDGCTHEASSRDPALTNTTSGITAAWLKTGAPHVPQKLRSVAPPWSSPTVVYVESVSPSTVNAPRGTATITE